MCDTEDIAAYAKWIEEHGEELNQYVLQNTTSNEYCNDAAAPKVNFDTVSKPVVETVQVAVDHVKNLQKLTDMMAKRKADECRFLTKQFLAKMKEHGCSASCMVAKAKPRCAKKTTCSKRKAKRRCG